MALLASSVKKEEAPERTVRSDPSHTQLHPRSALLSPSKPFTAVRPLRAQRGLQSASQCLATKVRARSLLLQGYYRLPLPQRESSSLSIAPPAPFILSTLLQPASLTPMLAHSAQIVPARGILTSAKFPPSQTTHPQAPPGMWCPGGGRTTAAPKLSRRSKSHAAAPTRLLVPMCTR